MENNKFVAIAIVIVGILIAGAIYFRPATPTTGDPNAQAKKLLAKMTPVSSTDHLRGSAQAPVTIVEYTDLECPFCKAYQWTMNELFIKYGPAGTNKLAWVFRNFPLASLHSKAAAEAEATECVTKLGGNEKFWQYVDKIYEITPSNNGLDLTLLPKIAKDLEIDETKFNDCIQNHEAKIAVDAQIKTGNDIGVDGTPFVVVINDNGEKILPFREPVPANWSAEAKQIVGDLLTSYEANINKLRSE